MVKVKTYPDLFTHRRQSVLLEGVQTSIHELGSKTALSSGLEQSVAAYRLALRELEPGLIARASPEIREIGGLAGWRKPRMKARLSRFVRQVRAPDCNWFLLFHGSGYEREYAFRGLDGAPQSGFEFAAIIFRMNDWVPQVRRAAFDYAAQYFPKTAPEVIEQAAFFLFEYLPVLSRWDADARKLAEDTLYQEKVLSLVAARLALTTNGPVARVLRLACKRPGLDHFIPELAKNAKSAAVRACANDMLLHGRTKWPEGYKRVWINKVAGQSQWVPDIRQRPLGITVDITNVLHRAANDRSAHVRRVVASFLITQLANPQERHREIAARLAQDESPGVALRIAFYFRKLQGG